MGEFRGREGELGGKCAAFAFFVCALSTHSYTPPMRVSALVPQRVNRPIGGSLSEAASRADVMGSTIPSKSAGGP